VTEFTVDNPNPVTFEVDPERRTIRGLALPFGDVAVSQGRRYTFAADTLTWGKVKVLDGHDWTKALGIADLEQTPEGILATMRIARGPRGDEALALAEDGVYDGLSAGLAAGLETTVLDGVHHSTRGVIREVSLTPLPAFERAEVRSVAASAAPNKEIAHMTEQTATVEETTPAVVELSSASTSALAEALAALAAPQTPARTTVAAGATVVTEPAPYRFDGIAGAHGFIDDLRAGYTQGDGAARQRLDTFLGEAFAVTSGNVGALNPTENRPELYVPNLQFNTPLYDLVSTGTLDDKTPFTVPKFGTATGLVGNHTEGVEPTPGAFTATNQTVTPAPISGKVEIVREVWDQGGNPKADAIIWGEMVGAYYEQRETKIAAALATTATAELNLAGAVDGPLAKALTNYYAGLQFVRGGNRFTATAADSKLFLALTNAQDTGGRNLFPVLGPANAQGQVDGGLSEVNLGNQRIKAAWALAQGANTRSYNFVPSSVWAWFSAPQRLTFEYQVKSIDMAVWGYGATAILRDSDVKPIDYDTSDV
jgi:HK97 family phage prohead protease